LIALLSGLGLFHGSSVGALPSGDDLTQPAPESLCALAPSPAESVLSHFARLPAVSPYVLWVRHGASHEGLPLGFAIVGAEDRLSRIEEIRSDLARLGDPRSPLSSGARKHLLRTLPAVVWLSCSVHGDELAPADAAIRLMEVLLSDTSAAAAAIRDSLIVLVDPLRNPDGRRRAIAQRRQWSSRCSVNDDESYHHREAWPDGRGNHYFIDLNRDAWHLSQPESQSRAEHIISWHPQVVVDLHEMRADDTYLFSPPRPPSAAFVPQTLDASWDRFSHAIAEAMTRKGLDYYRGDWHEAFAPDRLVAWSLHTGATGILLEVPGVDGTLVRQSDGRDLTYRETVDRHVLAAVAILSTAARHRGDLLAEFHAFRKDAVSGDVLRPDNDKITLCGSVEDRVEWLADDGLLPAPAGALGEYGRTDSDGRRRSECVTLAQRGARFVLLPPGRNESRRRMLAETLMRQGIEVALATEAAEVRSAVDSRGTARGRLPFPAGTCVVDLHQPMGALAATLLDAAPTMEESALFEERRSLLDDGRSTLYSYSAWSLPDWAGVDAWYADRPLQTGLAPVTAETFSPQYEGVVRSHRTSPVALERAHALLLDAADDASLLAVPRLLDSAIDLRVASETFGVGGRVFAPGTIVVPAGSGVPIPDVLRLCGEVGATPAPTSLGLTEAGPDLGSRTVVPVKAPRVAVLAGYGTSSVALGRLWFLFDQVVGLPVTLLPIQRVAQADLTVYNAVIVPDAAEERGRRLRELIGAAGWERLLDWVSFGGTLILCGESVAALPAGEQNGEPPVHIGLRRELLDRLPHIASEVLHELRSQALMDKVSERFGDQLHGFGPSLAEARSDMPNTLWQVPQTTRLEDLLAWDELLRRFSPQGVFMRLDVQRSHWLVSGLGQASAVPVRSSQVMHALPPASTIARFELGDRLCASGLLWPEATERWQGSSAIVRDKLGSGQVIALAGDFKHSSPVLERLVLNAALLGPSLVGH
jgi:hypothetical protein